MTHVTPSSALPSNGRLGARADSAGTLLRLIRTGQATTRAELGSCTGLARSTVSQRVDLLVAAGLIREIDSAPSGGGRRAAVLGFNPDAGVVLVADLGVTHSRLAVCALDGTPIEQTAQNMAIDTGPDQVLGWVVSVFDDLLARIDRPLQDVKGVTIGVPGPVDTARGEAINPPIMPGWNRVSIRPLFEERYGALVVVDNDVNLMAVAEHGVLDVAPQDFVFVKVGAGIGSGLIMSGHLHRGSRGAAGDIGHVQVGSKDVMCNCGNFGCLEAFASGAALARSLSAKGFDAHGSREVVDLVKQGNSDAIAEVREAGRLIGEVLATTVNLLNPSAIAIGGDLAMADEHLLAGVREVVYSRATTLGTTELSITRASLGGDAGIRGGAAMVLDEVFSPRNVDAVLDGSSSSGKGQVTNIA